MVEAQVDDVRVELHQGIVVCSGAAAVDREDDLLAEADALQCLQKWRACVVPEQGGGMLTLVSE